MATSTIITQLNAINLTLQSIVVALQVQPFWNNQWFAAIVKAQVQLNPVILSTLQRSPDYKS